MFGIILSSVFSLMHIYVFARIAGLPIVRRHLPIGFILGIAVALWVLFFLSRLLRFAHGLFFMAAVEFLGMAWLGTLFLLFIAMLAVDLTTLFGLILPRLAPTLRTYALAVGTLLALVALVQGLRPPVVRDYTASPAGLPAQMAGKKMVVLTDMHLGAQLGKRWLKDRVVQVQSMQPDLIVLVGDILDGHDGAMAELIPILRRFNALLGVFAVLGNHEFYRGAEKCTEVLESAGITVLRNRWVEVRPGLIVAGVDDLTAGRGLNSEGDLPTKALTGKPPGATILLSHTPWAAERAAAADVGLMLSGHTHNGQIWPFGYLVKRVYPLLYGSYHIAGMQVIVSRGSGTWGPRMRLWQPGEILRITFKKHV
jgi:uncharacterized protein